MEAEVQELFELAKSHLATAYVPYSHFPVSAVLKTANGKIYTGVNIENASYGLTNCAERTCLFNYINAGDLSEPITKFLIIGETKRPISPCGACRQVMAEFLSPETQIILANTSGQMQQYTLAELLPYYFTEEDLNHD